MKLPLPYIKESIDEFYEKYRQHRKAAIKRRVYMLILIKEEHVRTRKEVAKRIGVHRNTIGDWLKRYQVDGLTTLVEIKPPGAPCGQRSLPVEVVMALRERLSEATGFLSYIELHSWLKQTHDCDIKYKTLHRIVHDEMKAKLKVPRRSHKSKEEGAESSFREQLPDKLKAALAGRAIENARLLTQDESRFGLMPVTRRRISAKGVKPIGKVDFQFESYYLYGATDPLTGEAFYLEMPYLDSTCFQIYLNQLAHYFSNDFLIILTDNASAHKAKRLVIPDNIVFLPFPAYCPELNPIERLWQYIKAKIDFAFINTIDDLQRKVEDILKEQCTNTVVASITGYAYIIDALDNLMHS